MKSIYLRNFTAMAVLIIFCLMLICLSFLGIGRMHLIRVQRDEMIASAEEVSRIAAAVCQGDGLDSWLLGMNASAVANATGNQIFITDAAGLIVSCSDRTPNCRHLGLQMPENVMQQLERNGEYGMSDLGGIFPEARYVVTHEIFSELDGAEEGFVFVISAPGKMLGDWSAFLMIAATVTLGLVVFVLARPLLFIFSPEEEVVAFGERFIRIVTPFYITICFNQIYAGALRGIGDATMPTVIMLCSFVVFRQIYLFVTKALGAGFLAVALAYPMGWILCSVLLVLAYRRSALVRE